MSPYKIQWENLASLSAKQYTCGHCGSFIASEKGYFSLTTGVARMFIYICPYCNQPTYFDLNGNQVPGVAFGEIVEYISSTEVQHLYEEARRCVSCNAYTASILCCRKLLMNIAVAKGAATGLSFRQYVEFLDQQNYIPPDGKDWVDHIRGKGNEATHEIAIMQEDDAQDLITFIGMLLKFIYEFPAKIKEKQAK